MGSKFYAVRKGRKPGIYTAWDECKQHVAGYSGAEYKSFVNQQDAQNYLNHTEQTAPQKEADVINHSADEAVAYVDGSFNNKTKEFSYGAVIFWNHKEYHFSAKFDDAGLADMHNVAGELKGSEKAIEFALENKISKLTIYHDYEGIAKWCTGAWQAKKEGTQKYKQFYEQAKGQVDIHFIKVKGHSGDTYNELADSLAKKALLPSVPAV